MQYKNFILCFFVIASVLTTHTMPAIAEVRLGKNVYVGGHDFSNRTFNRNRNAVIYLHEGKPANAGCRWVAQKDRSGRETGRKTQVCDLQIIPEGKR